MSIPAAVLLFSGGAIHAANVVQNTFTIRRGTSEYTFTLFQAAPEVTWTEAYSACLAKGQHLAIVENQDVQDQLIFGNHSNGHVWLSGRRWQTRSAWKYANGEDETGK